MSNFSQSLSLDEISSLEEDEVANITPYHEFEDSYWMNESDIEKQYGKETNSNRQENIKKFLTKLPIKKNIQQYNQNSGIYVDKQENADEKINLNPGHIFILALIERICELHVNCDITKNRLFMCIINELCKMQILPYCIQEIEIFSSIRKSYISHFSLLFNSAIDTVINNTNVDDLFDPNIPTPPNLLHQEIAQISQKKNNIFYTRSQNDFDNFNKIGSGAYGVVFSTRNRLDKQLYAIKFIPFSICNINYQSLDELYREITFLSKIDHANLIRYYSSWVELVWSNADFEEILNSDYESGSFSESYIMNVDFDNQVNTSNSSSSDNKVSPEKRLHHTLCIQTELCHSTLQNWILTRNGIIKEIDKSDNVVNLSICNQIISGVNYLHSNNILHRDLKCTNIFISTSSKKFNKDLSADSLLTDSNISSVDYKYFLLDFVIKIGDFGLCKEFLAVNVKNEKLDATLCDYMTHTTSFGTEFYAAPEQLNSKYYDIKADMYSIGIIFFELYCPFSTQSERFTVIKNMKESKSRNKVDSYIGAVWNQQIDLINSLLSDDPNDRPNCQKVLSYPLFLSKEQKRIKELEEKVQELERKLEKFNKK